MNPIVEQAKDAVSLATLVWTATQILKGLIRWRAETEPPNSLIIAIAACIAWITAAAALPRGDVSWHEWLLNVGLYALVAILPLAMAAHQVAGIGAGPLVAQARRLRTKLGATPITGEPTRPGDDETRSFEQHPHPPDETIA